MELLHEVLRYYEDNLDPEHIQKVKQRIKKAMEYGQTDGLSIRTGFPCTRFRGRPYSEEIMDMGTMLFNQLVSFQQITEVKDDTLPMIRANYGTGILPSAFGLNCTIIDDQMPWVNHVDSEDEIQRIIDRGIPDMRAGLMGKVFETHEFFQEQLSRYPNCQRLIPIYHPDMQGPFDVAHLIWGSQIYYAVYDKPEMVHSLLRLITEAYIQFMKEFKKTIRDEDAPGYVYHWGTLFRGSIVLRNDSPVNLSKDMYEEFVRPYDEKILDAFGGGSMHYCGRADQWIFSMMECKGIEALNFGQPPNLVFEFDFLKKIYGRAKERKIPIAGYIMKKDIVPSIMSTEYTTGITYQTDVSNKEEAQRLLDMVR